MDSTRHFMELAFLEAEKSLLLNEVPVGAVIVDNNSLDIIVSTHNLIETSKDPTAHAEIIAIKQACCVLNTTKLSTCSIYITLEPCMMCAYALMLARIAKIYFASFDNKNGAFENKYSIFQFSNHKPEVYGGILEERGNRLLKNFFKVLRG